MLNDPQMNEIDETNPYTYRINADQSFTVAFHGEDVFTSRAYRLRGQAEGQANEWIQREINTSLDGINLTVQNLSIDAETLFRRNKNG